MSIYNGPVPKIAVDDATAIESVYCKVHTKNEMMTLRCDHQTKQSRIVHESLASHQPETIVQPFYGNMYDYQCFGEPGPVLTYEYVIERLREIVVCVIIHHRIC